MSVTQIGPYLYGCGDGDGELLSRSGDGGVPGLWARSTRAGCRLVCAACSATRRVDLHRSRAAGIASNQWRICCRPTSKAAENWVAACRAATARRGAAVWRGAAVGVSTAAGVLAATAATARWTSCASGGGTGSAGVLTDALGDHRFAPRCRRTPNCLGLVCFRSITTLTSLFSPLDRARRDEESVALSWTRLSYLLCRPAFRLREMARY